MLCRIFLKISISICAYVSIKIFRVIYLKILRVSFSHPI